MLITVAEASRLSGISNMAILHRLNKGTLVGVKGKYRWSVERSEVLRIKPLTSLKPRPKKHGAVGTPTYKSYNAMRRRCLDVKAHNYKWYGGRGIKVCKRWFKSFNHFLEDMGERPKGKTLDRKDNDGNYKKSNCRWATSLEQRHNRRNS